MVDEVKCPKCGCELETDDTIDIDHEGSYISCLVVGHCPKCGADYHWTEYFEFDRVSNLMEIEGQKMKNEIKDSLAIRKEFINAIMDAVEELRAKATTQGEVALLYYMLKSAQECTE